MFETMRNNMKVAREQAKAEKAALKERNRNDPLSEIFIGNGETVTLYHLSIEYKGKNFDNERKDLAGVRASVESGSELQSRFTATRILLLGVFVLAFKKKKGGEKYLVIEGEDFVWTVEVDRKHINKAMKFAGRVNDAVKDLPRPAITNDIGQTSDSDISNLTNTDDPIEQVKRLKMLLDAGAITQEEFEQLKKRALNL